uniref:Death domain-containing protein n=1 Tax=Amphimedon queenslandica TaxID=400682 RepID=A0A1X7UJD7_AMPQE
MKPAELRLPHHVDATNPLTKSKVALLTAKDEFFNENELHFTKNDDSVLEVDSALCKTSCNHFCSTCAAIEKSSFRDIRKRCRVAVAEKQESDGTYLFHCIIFPSQLACKKTIEEQYSQKNFVLEFSFKDMTFGDGGISLIFDPDNLEGWSRSHCGIYVDEILEDDVDYHKVMCNCKDGGDMSSKNVAELKDLEKNCLYPPRFRYKFTCMDKKAANVIVALQGSGVNFKYNINLKQPGYVPSKDISNLLTHKEEDDTSSQKPTTQKDKNHSGTEIIESNDDQQKEPTIPKDKTYLPTQATSESNDDQHKEPGIQEVKPTTNDSPTQISESNDDQQKDPTTQKDSSTQIASESNDDQKKVILTIENLAEILQVLKDGQFLPTKWFNFGLSLGLSYRECKIIEHKYQRDAEQCLRECLANWLRKDTEATWDRLTNATDQEGEASVASYITSGAAGIETNSQFPIVPDHSDDKTNESGNNTDTNHPESERPQKIEGATKSTTVELTSQKIDKKIASRVLSENITLIIKCIKEFELTELAEKFMEIRIITREEMEDFVKDVKKNTRSYRMNNIKMKQLLIQLERAVSLSLRPGEIFLWLIKILKDYDTVASQEVARKLEAEYNARIFGDMTDLIVDSSGLIHHCSQYGVTLIIPEGAVQEEETVTVHFGTCLYSSKFKFGNYIPVTPIVWVHMSQELMKLAELYLPHHVDATNPLTRSKLTLLTAKDEFFNENELHFTKNDDSVLEVDFALCKTSRNHFCSTCAGIEKSSFENIQKRCWLAVAEKQESDVTFLFHCIIFPSQLACKKTIEKHYSQDFSLDFSFKEMNFDTGAISLTFDPDHDNLKTLGWTSRHFGIYVDEISEDDVDYHKVMHCQFRDMSSKDIHKPPCQDEDTSSKDIEKLEDLEKHRRYPPRFCYEFTCIDKTAAPKVTKVIVTLQGSSVNFRYDINLKQPGYDPSQDTSNLLTHKRENDISSQNLDSLLLGCLEVIPSIFEKFQCYKKWFPFGLSLGLNPSELLSIESRYRTPVQYARAILLLWREKNKEASLESLTAALEKVCLSEAATELQHHFQVGLSLVDATPAERVSEEVISSTVPEVAHRVISEFASAIKNCGIELSFFAEKLLEKKIINDRQKKKATDEHSRCTTDERMDQLLGIIKNSVQQEGKVFDYILEILKEENTILANKLHDNMINKYEQYK